jgi:hypothetical protein
MLINVFFVQTHPTVIITISKSHSVVRRLYDGNVAYVKVMAKKQNTGYSWVTIWRHEKLPSLEEDHTLL